MNIRKIIGAMVGLFAMAAIVPAQAQTAIAPSTNGVTVSGTGIITGTEIAPALTSQLVSINNGPSGTFTSQVFQGFGGNPLGGLTFVYTINESVANVGDGFSGLTASGFAGFNTDVGFVTANTTSSAAITANRSNSTGNRLDFGFGPLTVSANQVQLVVFTNSNNISFQTDSVANGGAHFVPAYGAAAPEPASFAVFGFVGLGVLSLMVRARRGKTQLAV